MAIYEAPPASKLAHIIGSWCAVSLAILMGAATYGCSVSYHSYNDAMAACAKAGGNFIPTGHYTEYQCLTLLRPTP